MTDLPQIYAEIVAKRPELAVPALKYEAYCWWRSGIRVISDDEAEALIGWHWTKMMPTDIGLMRDGCSWYVIDANGDGLAPRMPTPLAALAAFWRQQ